jgi:hypothetical protein
VVIVDEKEGEMVRAEVPAKERRQEREVFIAGDTNVVYV